MRYSLLQSKGYEKVNHDENEEQEEGVKERHRDAQLVTNAVESLAEKRFLTLMNQKISIMKRDIGGGRELGQRNLQIKMEFARGRNKDPLHINPTQTSTTKVL